MSAGPAFRGGASSAVEVTVSTPHADVIDPAEPPEAQPSVRAVEETVLTATKSGGTSFATVAARPASEQILAAIRQSAEGAVDLQLSPEELGRVRITLSPSEHGLAIAVHAERTETLELLRRNIDSLANAYREIGYESLSFTFSGGSQMPQRGAPEALPEHRPIAEAEVANPVATAESRTHAPVGRLDLRL